MKTISKLTVVIVLYVLGPFKPFRTLIELLLSFGKIEFLVSMKICDAMY
jgi:hypothetical protein